jgi:integrase
MRWRDLDRAARRIRVRRAYVRGESGTRKSKGASTAVPMINRVAAELDGLVRIMSVHGAPNAGEARRP